MAFFVFFGDVATFFPYGSTLVAGFLTKRLVGFFPCPYPPRQAAPTELLVPSHSSSWVLTLDWHGFSYFERILIFAQKNANIFPKIFFQVSHLESSNPSLPYWPKILFHSPPWHVGPIVLYVGLLSSYYPSLLLALRSWWI